MAATAKQILEKHGREATVECGRDLVDAGQAQSSSQLAAMAVIYYWRSQRARLASGAIEAGCELRKCQTITGGMGRVMCAHTGQECTRQPSSIAKA